MRLALVIAILILSGCAAAPQQPAAVPAPKRIAQDFDLVVTEANVAGRSGAGRSCVILQSTGWANVTGSAVAEWAARAPNPSTLRFGWLDDDHAAPPPSVSGPSPLALAFDGRTGPVGHGLRVFVGSADGTPLVLDQPVVVTVDATYEGDPVEPYVSSCTVN